MNTKVSAFSDKYTGSKVVQWTSSENDDQHLYFTSPSITDDDKFLIIISTQNGNPNLYAIDRNTHQIIQISRATGLLHSYTYPNGGTTGFSKASPFLDSKQGIVYWIQDDSVWASKVEIDSKPNKLADLPAGWVTGYIHLSPDRKSLCIPCTDPLAFSRSDLTQHDQLKRVPQRMVESGLVSKLLILDIEKREIKILAELPFWATHVQFVGNNQILCNSEGGLAITGNRTYPYWGRMWLVDDQGGYKRLFDQQEGEYVNHENLLQASGNIIYHGTDKLSLANKLQLYFYLGLNKYFKFKIDPNKIQEIYRHFVAIRDIFGNLKEIIYVNFPVSHAVEGNTHFSFFVDSRDGFIYGKNIVSNGMSKICCHGSRMLMQDSHPHPRTHNHTISLIFTSDIAGSCNVYEVTPNL